ncbi:MAG: 50S ribosomal protein L11 methyltransferase, partial [Lachnospiraceae bacterium]|nr:50S ribosomal protein L11 methyltransferase [Lachnospiraceae bacterium]
ESVKHEAGDGCYDIVVANILADVIIPLEKVVARHLKPGGLFISSGIINLKEEAVRKALEENEAFTIVERNELGEWVSFTARKKG